MRTIIRVVLLALILPWPGFCPAQDRTAAEIERLTVEGNGRFRMGAFTEAEESFRAIIALDADNAEAWNNLALVLVQLGRMDEAGAAVGRALAIKPGTPAFLANQGLVHLKAGRLDQAQQALDQALAGDPRLFAAQVRLARVAQARGDHTRALAAAKVAAGLDGSASGPCVIMAEAYAALGDKRAALDYYLMAEARDKSDAGICMAAGALAAELGDRPRAIRQYGEALYLRPDDHDLRLHLAALCHEVGDDRQAADHFIRVHEQGPDRLKTEAAYGAALTLAALGDHAGAEPFARTAVERQPDDQRYRALLGTVYEKQGKLKEAAAIMAVATPADPQALRDLGIRQENAGDLESAARTFRQGVASFPDQPIFALKLGVVLTARSDPAGARDVYQAALARSGNGPETPLIAFNLGRLEHAGNDPGAAMRAYRRAIACRPGMIKAYAGLAAAYVAYRPWTRPLHAVIWGAMICLLVVWYGMHRRNVRRSMAAPVKPERKVNAKK